MRGILRDSAGSLRAPGGDLGTRKPTLLTLRDPAARLFRYRCHRIKYQQCDYFFIRRKNPAFSSMSRSLPLVPPLSSFDCPRLPPPVSSFLPASPPLLLFIHDPPLRFARCRLLRSFSMCTRARASAHIARARGS